METDNIHRNVALWLLEPGTCPIEERNLENFGKKVKIQGNGESSKGKESDD